MADGSENTELTSGVGAVFGGPEATGTSSGVEPQTQVDNPLAGLQEVAAANTGIFDPNKARGVLEQLAGGNIAIQGILAEVLFGNSDLSEPIVERMIAQLVQFNFKPGSTKEAERALLMISRRVKERTTEAEKKLISGKKTKAEGKGRKEEEGEETYRLVSFSEMIDQLKKSENPFAQALGYDLEIHHLEARLTALANREQQLTEALNSEAISSDKKTQAKIKEELEKIKKQLQEAQASQQQIKQLKEKRKEIKDTQGRDIPDQAMELARRVGKAVGVDFNDTDNPVQFLIDSFASQLVGDRLAGIEGIISFSRTEEGVTITVNNEVMNKLMEGLKTQGVISEQDENDFKEAISQTAKIIEQQSSKILQEIENIFLFEKVAKGVLLAIILMLVFNIFKGFQTESKGGGQHRGMM